MGPVVDITFIDRNGQEVSSASLGAVEVRLNATDVCDEAPTVSGTATPVMEVVDGDIIKINRMQDDIHIPTTAIEVRATGRESSGNVSSAMKTLLIE